MLKKILISREEPRPSGPARKEPGGLGTRLRACVTLRSRRRFFSNMAEGLKKITLEEVKTHNVAGSSWLVIHNKVFDVTKFLDEVSEVLFEEQQAKTPVLVK